MPEPDDTLRRRERVESLQAAMDRHGVDLCVMGPGADMTYLSGATPHADERLCLLLVARRGLALVMPALNADEVAATVDLPMHTHRDEEGHERALRSALGAVGAAGARRVAVEESMRSDALLALVEALPGAAPERLGPYLGPIRARKDPSEIEVLRRNARQADAAMRAVAAAARVGMRERELADVAEAAFREAGARPQFAIVASGEHGAFPHHASGDRRLRSGDAVVVDIGARWGGYCSDITRSLVVGVPPADFARVHRVVDAAVEAALAAVRPGAVARDVDAAARAVIDDAGYGDRFVHRVGHGIGMTVHEPPYLTATSDEVLEVGMTHSVEPGIYLPGAFGVRLEEIVVVTERGCEVLSELARDPLVVEV